METEILPSASETIRRKLHEAYSPGGYDNRDLWAGNLSVTVDTIPYPAYLARAFVGHQTPSAAARVKVELYVSDVDPLDVQPQDLVARLWTDVNERGTTSAEAGYEEAFGHAATMSLVTDASGRPFLAGNNLVYESAPFEVTQTGVFSYSASFSADGLDADDPAKSWVALNDIAHNKDGVICASPDWVRTCPSIAEVCVRKTGARLEDGRFISGTFSAVTEQLDQIPADIIYLLPFFEPGFIDSGTGEDVRKGELGSPYAVRDFFRIDPDLVSVVSAGDMSRLASEGLITEQDLSDLALDDPPPGLDDPGRLAEALGEQGVVQLLGRAELRRLVSRAHELGKRVIFDLVLKQTSRDCPLIDTHPEWYVMDEAGRPQIHQIAWLIYSDVALLDLTFNRPLQHYLASIAPYWIERCGFDGVRIDASQTIDRPFLKEIKNRIHLAKPDALVLGETLCALDESKDIPVDMVYALLVDFHRDVQTATPYIDFLEQTSGSFPPRTLALAYFENHDSPRATAIWRERFLNLLVEDERAHLIWQKRCAVERPEVCMALLRNLQAILINVTAGSAGHTNLAYGLEMGTWYGEEAPTDFEHTTLQRPEQAEEPPYTLLVEAYGRLADMVGSLKVHQTGNIYFHRNTFKGGDPEDRVLAYSRTSGDEALLVVHNLDPVEQRSVTLPLREVPSLRFAARVEVIMDTAAWLQVDGEAEVRAMGERVEVTVGPLGSVAVRV